MMTMRGDLIAELHERAVIFRNADLPERTLGSIGPIVRQVLAEVGR